MDLDQFNKSDPRKIQIARRLRQETIMPLRWIANRLQKAGKQGQPNLWVDPNGT